MGSKADLEWSEKIRTRLEAFGIEVIMRIASAHKVPTRCYEIVKTIEEEVGVFITVAGRSNALSGFVDAQTYRPVIACPPYSDRFGGADIYSSLRMPSGVAPMVVLETEAAAVAAAKIIGISNPDVRQRVAQYQEEARQKIIRDDEEISNG